MAVVWQGPGPEDSYVQIPNSLARDPDIPNRAKAVYIFMRSHRDGWGITTERTAEALGLSKGTVAAAMKDLEEAGYMRRWKARSEGGTFAGWEYEILSQPLTVTQKTDHGKNRPSEKADVGKISTHKKTNSFKKTSNLKEDQSAPEGAHGYPEGFEEFFLEYPRKSDKRGALKRYREQLEVTDHNTLMRSVKNFRAEMERLQTEQRYIPMCKTWLNQGRWRDFVDYAPKKSGKEKLNQALSWLEEM